MYNMLRLSLIVAASLISSQLNAEPTSLRGNWQQVLSNAGACERCLVSIRQSGSALEVIANNGWTATVFPNQDASNQTAKGEGRWGPNAGGFYKGAVVSDLFRSEPQRTALDGYVGARG